MSCQRCERLRALIDEIADEILTAQAEVCGIDTWDKDKRRRALERMDNARWRATDELGGNR